MCGTPFSSRAAVKWRRACLMGRGFIRQEARKEPAAQARDAGHGITNDEARTKDLSRVSHRRVGGAQPQFYHALQITYPRSPSQRRRCRVELATL